MKSAPLKAEYNEETISYYQIASYLYKHGLYSALTNDEFIAYMRQGRILAAKAQSAK
jgi:hypothetical protein